ncbi:hypothetical protein F2P56_017056 [Juglans regia]|uniref:Uncharacterized protein n=2 Tax=Juglans regia TaxID=51240 RepID=A0A833XKE9_JUGRE|nr:uncharacterized protein LOC108996539 [Juglans regia]KAF5467206.1 hypothetical protein F2P56_017056 [Juglans regia]
MPVSGNEETGVKPISRQASDYIAGVPIKKRRFPFPWLSPSPSEEPTSFAAENNSSTGQSDLLQEQSDSLQKKQSSPSWGSTISTASAATCYSGISDAHKKPVSEEPKENSDHINVTLFQNIPNYRVKLEEPCLRIHSGSVGNMDCKDKLVAAKNSELPITLAKTKLKVAPNEALVLTMGKETYSDEKSEGNYLSKKLEGKCKAEIPTIPGNIELTLGLKEHLFPALAGQNSDGTGQKRDSLEPSSLNLSLSNTNSSIQWKKDDVELNNGVQLCANRANWDLNVLMDAWQCSASDAAADQVSIDDFNPADRTHDIKPFICSTGMIGPASSSEHNSVSENRANFDISSKLSGQQNEIVDSLHLGLSPTSFQSQVSQEPSCLSAKEDFGRVFPNMSLPRLEASTSNLDRVNHRTVKSEPFDESMKLDNIGTKGYSMGLLNSRTLKHELVDCSLAKSSNISALKLGGPESIKTEPVHEDRQALNKIDGTSRVEKQVLQGLSNHSIAMPLPETAPTSCTAVEPSCSTELIIAGDVANNFEHSRCTEGAHSNGEVVPQEAWERTQLVASETVDTAVGHNGKESNTSVMTDNVRAEDGNSDDPEQCRLQCLNDHLPDMQVSEDSVSDEEKIEISADMLEDSYSSDYESDGNHPLARAMDTKQDGEEDDYEDGEVREPLVDNAVEEEPICEKEAEHVDHGDSDNRKMDIIGQDGDYHATSSRVEEKDYKTEDPDETNNKDNSSNDDRVEGVSSSSADKLSCLQESPDVEKLSGAGMKRPINDIQGKPRDQSGSKDCLKEKEKESSSEQTSKGNQEAVATVDENVKKILMLEKNDAALPKMEASADGDDVAKDVNNGGIRSRIINLSRASHVLSPGKTRPISARSLPSQAGTEIPDVVLEGENLHPQGRDELYMDGSHKFSRERHQDNPTRNPRLNFMRGRGRITSRLDTLHGDWDSDHDFNSGFYNGTTEFRVPRHKYASAVPDTGLEYNSYNIAPEGSFFGTGRGRRKHLNDDIFRRIPSRRQSSGGRDIPAARGGGQMIRRVTRNVSPGRCVDEDGSEVVGPRHSEKFVRVFTDDTMEPMFTRPQPAYEGVGGHFARGTRNFSSVQRRGLPRMHSKSPIRSRSRSPVPWPSPRRRSQDGFGGPPELIHRRSPPIYRMERMRSPDRPCFTGDLMVRRHGSPPYFSRSSNDLRDMDSGRDNGHPRSVIPNRSQSGRILLRNRQFDAINPREKTGSDEYFGGPMNTGRLHELSGDANGDDRRRFGGRRGPVRSFRPPYNDANGEGFHLNSEDGPRPFRFYPEDDSEFHQRGNLRDRGFDQRIKNQPGNVHRRTRSIEEQEVNYRRGGQVWQDDGFDEISRVKRKRF